MPVHEFLNDHHLQEKGLTNYWGYNTIAFLAPHHAYATPSGRAPATRCRSSRRWSATCTTRASR